jgi:hypothetical protein
MDTHGIPLWAFEMLKSIQDSDYARIELVVLNGAHMNPGENPASSPQRTLPQKILRIPKVLSNLLSQKLFSFVESRALVSHDAFSDSDAQELLGDVPTMTVSPVMKRHSDYFPEADIQEIPGHEIDVFIRLGFRILRGDILSLPKSGVWSFHHGDNRVNRGGPAGFWEVFHDWPETGSILQILTEDLDNGEVLVHATSQTINTSVKVNKNNLYWKTQAFIPKKLQELHALGHDRFFERVGERRGPLQMYSNQLFRQPDNRTLVLASARIMWRRLKEKLYRGRFHDQWILLLSMNARSDVPSTSLWRFKEIVPPDDRFWADPHIVKRDETYYVFIEELIYSEGKGKISCMEVDDSGNWKTPYPVLELDCHLSYPFVFEYEDRLYMIPETADKHRIELYECTDFPGKWAFRKVLMKDVRATDATLHFHNGRWWLFAGIKENDDYFGSDQLCLFHAANPLSDEWEPHPCNPIVTEVARARPAGRLFECGGRLYRPSQNCSVRYGYGFNLAEITALDTETYQERIVSEATPDWSETILGTHTFSWEGRLTMSDAILKRRKG